MTVPLSCHGSVGTFWPFLCLSGEDTLQELLIKSFWAGVQEIQLTELIVPLIS